METISLATIAALSTPALLARIEQLQAIQKRNPPKSQEWQNASAQLQPCFAEMARREPAQ